MPTWKVTVASYYRKLQEYLVEADTDLDADSKWAFQQLNSEGDLEFTEDEVLSIELEEGP